jgi:hypothetical protein
MGFATPDASFVSGGLRTMMRDAISDPAFIGLPFLDRPAIERLLERPERDARALWRLFTLALWQESFRAVL